MLKFKIRESKRGASILCQKDNKGAWRKQVTFSGIKKAVPTLAIFTICQTTREEAIAQVAQYYADHPELKPLKTPEQTVDHIKESCIKIESGWAE